MKKKKKVSKRIVKKTVTKKAKKPSEKQLKNQIEKDFLNLFVDENESEYIEKVDRFTEFKKLDKRKKYTYEGKKYSHKTLYNKLLNDAIKINTIKSEAEKRLDSDKKKAKRIKAKMGEFATVLKAWDSDSLKSEVLDNMSIDSVNGINLENDMDSVSDQLDELRLRASSTDSIVVLINYKTRKARIGLIDNEEAQNLENE